MPIDLFNRFDVHAQAMLLRGRRAEILAANLANADTPHYKARDINFQDVMSRALGRAGDALPLRATQSGHVQSAADASGGELLYRIPHQSSLDGNTVDTQVEQAEFTQNALQYQASLTFLNNHIRGLLTAFRGE
ncbi:MAG: flagellar basal body rod protein FlgB [Pseudomonadota bacterium]